jgi:prolyl oligopeptidase
MNTHFNSYLIMLFILLTMFYINNNSQTKIQYPMTKKVVQVDNYFGTLVSDPYRWLEETDSPEVLEWIEQQNKITFDYLEQIPFRNKIKQRLTEIWNYPKYSQPIRTEKNYFFYKNDGLQNQSVLYYQKDLNSEPEVFLDPNTFSDDGTVSLGGIYDSKDGKYLAYSINRSGSDWEEIYVMDVDSKIKLDDHLNWIKYSGVSWYKDGFYYSRFDKPEDKNIYTTSHKFQKVYYHKLGTNQEQDELVFEDKSHPEHSHFAWTTEDDRYLLLSIEETGKKGNSVYYKELDKQYSKFKPIVKDFENNYWPVDNFENKLIIMTNKDAPKYKIELIDLNNTASSWKTILPEQNIVLNSARFVDGKIIAIYMKDATNRVYIYDIEGNLLNEVKLPSLGSVYGFNGKKNDKQVFYTFTSFTYPPEIFLYDIEKQQSTLFHRTEVKFNPDEYETKQIFYKSKDGTSIPMFIVHKKGLVLDGKNPAYLYGYGGFNVNMEPYFGVSRLILLENGGVFAVPNIRGGGEEGEEWHKAGMLSNKQNVFDDFIAAAEYLINEKYTSPEMLAISGGSNGGLLIGAVLNQRPEICRIGLPAVGVMDMLRYQKFTAGRYWVSEFGSSDDSINFRNLYSYSPIHNIREGLNYPAILVTTADHDDRVVPLHSFKYISTLQEKYKGDNPVLIRIERKAGHGFGLPMTKIIEENTDIWTFMFYNMGIEPRY